MSIRKEAQSEISELADELGQYGAEKYIIEKMLKNIYLLGVLEGMDRAAKKLEIKK